MNQNSNEEKNTIKTFTQEEVNSIVQKRLAKESDKLSQVQSKYEGLKQFQEGQAVKEILLKEGFNPKHLGKITKLIDKDKDIASQINELKEIQGFTSTIEAPKTIVEPEQKINTSTLNVSGGNIKTQNTKPDFKTLGKYKL